MSTPVFQPINTYIQGDVAQVTATFRVEGVVTNPSTVTVKIEPPASSGVAEYALVYGVDLSLVRDSTGVYHTNVALPYPGKWKYRWVSTGVAPGAAERFFEVKASALSVP